MIEEKEKIIGNYARIQNKQIMEGKAVANCFIYFYYKIIISFLFATYIGCIESIDAAAGIAKQHNAIKKPDTAYKHTDCRIKH